MSIADVITTEQQNIGRSSKSKILGTDFTSRGTFLKYQFLVNCTDNNTLLPGVVILNFFQRLNM